MDIKRRGFTIEVFVVDGSSDGLRIVRKSNWIGCAAMCSRPRFADFKKREEFQWTGVYVLIGPSEESDLPTLYIGSGEPVLSRFESHESQRAFWTSLIVFTGEGDNLNKAQAGYLEARLHELAVEAKRCQLDNTNKPQKPKLSEADEAEVETFLDEMLLIYPLLGVDAFERLQPKPAVERMLYVKAKGIEARGYESGSTFVVLGGSTAVLDETKSIPASYSARRRQLEEQGVLKHGRTQLVLQHEYTFSSPSTAAGVLLGMSANGRDLWKDAKGRTLNEIECDEEAERIAEEVA